MKITKKIIKENIIKPYSVITEVYNKKHFDESSFEGPLDHFLGLLGEKKMVLDAGCGPGGESKYMVDKGFSVIGVDITKEMISLAEKNVPNMDFIEMDVRELDFKSNTFDGIWSARTLIHISSEEIVGTLKEWKRVLKDRGVLCLCVLGGSGELIEPEYYDPSGKTSTFFHYFSEFEIKENIIDAGFEVIDLYTLPVGNDKEPHIFVFARKV